MMLRSALIACAGALLWTSCAADVGECNSAQLGGSTGANPAPYAGQQLLQSSCASGRCHSSTAKGAARSGAPSGLDFNVVPNSPSEADVGAARHAFGVVSNNISEIWGEVDEGSMPPPKPAGAGALSPSNKEVIRNWLACGAPIVEAPAGAPPGSDKWTSIFAQLSGACSGCHASATSMFGANFVLGDAGDACGAYTKVLGTAAKTAACSGRVIVKAGDPANSVLLQKLNGVDVCGPLMPPGASTPYATSNASVVNDLQSWIMSGAPAPSGCN